MNNYKIVNEESFEWLKTQPDNTIDSIITDPPYLINFMGKAWDSEDSVAGSSEFWEEALRVLKPGGHAAVFSHSRTYHRVASAIEDAGFEIRDQLMWVYGSGFPKSHNIGKAYDKKMGNERKVVGDNPNKVGRTSDGKGGFGGKNQFDSGEHRVGNDATKITKGTSPYEGWGTALKPAHEPIVLARKPLSEKTVVDNVIKWGTGAINIDDCRVGNEVRTYDLTMTSGNFETTLGGKNKKSGEATVEGRFPANLIHDGSQEVLELFPQAKGGAYPKKRGEAVNSPFGGGQEGVARQMGDDGSAARFFYCAKVSKKERNVGCDDLEGKKPVGRDEGQDARNVPNKPRPITSKNHHPTVKPVSLMAYLCKLITPKGGTVLDLFNGSGSTGMACKQEGFDYIGVEMNEEYCEISKRRIEKWNS